jgi:signal transduction histidine kinase
LEKNPSHLSSRQFGKQIIIDHLWDGILIVDFKGKILSANTAAHVLFHKNKDELIGENYAFQVNPSRIEKIQIHRRGKVCHIESLANVISWNEEDVYLISLRDVTKTVRNRKSLKKPTGVSNKRDEFIAVASHELKTPLTCLKAYNDLIYLSIQDKNYDEAKLYSGKISTFVNRLTNITNDLLEVSHIQSGKVHYNLEIIDVQKLLSDAIAILAPITPSHRIILKGKVAARIKADKRKIEQVLANLVGNAATYSPGSNKVIVSVSLSEKNVVFKVQDFGIGISDENLQNIFYMFFRSERVINRFQGLGLGLFIAAQIIKSHKGQLQVESKVNEGSVFTFTLPLFLGQAENLN